MASQKRPSTRTVSRPRFTRVRVPDQRGGASSWLAGHAVPFMVSSAIVLVLAIVAAWAVQSSGVEPKFGMGLMDPDCMSSCNNSWSCISDPASADCQSCLQSCDIGGGGLGLPVVTSTVCDASPRYDYPTTCTVTIGGDLTKVTGVVLTFGSETSTTNPAWAANKEPGDAFTTEYIFTTNHTITSTERLKGAVERDAAGGGVVYSFDPSPATVTPMPRPSITGFTCPPLSIGQPANCTMSHSDPSGTGLNVLITDEASVGSENPAWLSNKTPIGGGSTGVTTNHSLSGPEVLVPAIEDTRFDIATNRQVSAWVYGSPLTVEPRCSVTPTVATFTTTPSTISAGGASTISIDVQNVDGTGGTGVELRGPTGNVVFSTTGSGTVSVNPTATTAYSLYARPNGGGCAYQLLDTKTVTVNAVPTCTTNATIDTFTASPSTITTAGGSSSLSWTTSNAASVSIDNGVGSKPVDGTASVSPAATTTYTLTATPTDTLCSPVTRTVTVTYSAPSGALSTTATCTPTTVQLSGTLSCGVTFSGNTSLIGVKKIQIMGDQGGAQRWLSSQTTCPAGGCTIVTDPLSGSAVTVGPMAVRAALVDAGGTDDGSGGGARNTTAVTVTASSSSTLATSLNCESPVSTGEVSSCNASFTGTSSATPRYVVLKRGSSDISNWVSCTTAGQQCDITTSPLSPEGSYDVYAAILDASGAEVPHASWGHRTITVSNTPVALTIGACSPNPVQVTTMVAANDTASTICQVNVTSGASRVTGLKLFYNDGYGNDIGLTAIKPFSAGTPTVSIATEPTVVRFSGILNSQSNPPQTTIQMQAEATGGTGQRIAVSGNTTPVTIREPSGDTCPTITSFDASPTLVDVGGQSTLTWTVTGVAAGQTATYSIDQGVGTVTGTNAGGSKAVTVSASTIYTITARVGATCTVTKAVAVDVRSISAPASLVAGCPGLDAQSNRTINPTCGEASPLLNYAWPQPNGVEACAGDVWYQLRFHNGASVYTRSTSRPKNAPGEWNGLYLDYFQVPTQLANGAYRTEVSASCSNDFTGKTPRAGNDVTIDAGTGPNTPTIRSMSCTPLSFGTAAGQKTTCTVSMNYATSTHRISIGKSGNDCFVINALLSGIASGVQNQTASFDITADMRDVGSNVACLGLGTHHLQANLTSAAGVKQSTSNIVQVVISDATTCGSLQSCSSSQAQAGAAGSFTCQTPTQSPRGSSWNHCTATGSVYCYQPIGTCNEYQYCDASATGSEPCRNISYPFSISSATADFTANTVNSSMDIGDFDGGSAGNPYSYPKCVATWVEADGQVLAASKSTVVPTGSTVSIGRSFPATASTVVLKARAYWVHTAAQCTVANTIDNGGVLGEVGTVSNVLTRSFTRSGGAQPSLTVSCPGTAYDGSIGTVTIANDSTATPRRVGLVQAFVGSTFVGNMFRSQTTPPDADVVPIPMFFTNNGIPETSGAVRWTDITFRAYDQNQTLIATIPSATCNVNLQNRRAYEVVVVGSIGSGPCSTDPSTPTTAASGTSITVDNRVDTGIPNATPGVQGIKAQLCAVDGSGCTDVTTTPAPTRTPDASGFSVTFANHKTSALTLTGATQALRYSALGDDIQTTTVEPATHVIQSKTCYLRLAGAGGSTVDAAKSTVTISQSPICPTGQATVTVTVRDASGAAVPGATVTLTSAPAGLTIGAATYTGGGTSTNGTGVATFTVTGGTVGTTYTLTAKAKVGASAEVTITQTASLTINTCGGGACQAPTQCGTPPNCTAPSGCDNVCGSTRVNDCRGVCGGTAVVDACGVCGGDGSSCACPTPPTGTLTADRTTLLSNQTATITLTTSNSNGWTLAASSGTLSKLTGTTTNDTSVFTPNASGNVTITLRTTSSNNACQTGTKTLTLLVNDAGCTDGPGAELSITPATITQGDTATLTVTTTRSASWALTNTLTGNALAPATGTGNATNTQVTYTGTNRGSDTITLRAVKTSTNAACSDATKTVTITVNAPAGPVCGDRVTEGTEQCDDGNTTNADGCSSTCQLEAPLGVACPTTGISVSSIRGIWTPNTGVASYGVSLLSGSTTVQSATEPKTASSHDFNGLISDTDYTFRVVANGANNSVSAASSVVCRTKAALQPSMTLTANPTTILADGQSTSTLTAQLYNYPAMAGKAPTDLSGYTITFVRSPTSTGTLLAASAVTDTAGRASVQVRAPSADGVGDFTASEATKTTSATAQVLYKNAAGTTITVALTVPLEARLNAPGGEHGTNKTSTLQATISGPGITTPYVKDNLQTDDAGRVTFDLPATVTAADGTVLTVSLKSHQHLRRTVDGTVQGKGLVINLGNRATFTDRDTNMLKGKFFLPAGDVEGGTASLHDNRVTNIDLTAWITAFRMSAPPSPVSDLDGNGSVGAEDLSLIIRNFNSQGDS